MESIVSLFLMIGVILIFVLSTLLVWLSIKYYLIAVTIPQRIIKLQNNETYNGFLGALANSPTYMNFISLSVIVIAIISGTVNAVVAIMAEKGYFDDELSITITTIILIISFITNLTISTIVTDKLNSSTINKILASFSPFYALYIAFRNAGINDWRKMVALILALFGFLNYIVITISIMVVADPFLSKQHPANQVAMARSDIASTLKAVPARVFAENLDPTASAPYRFSNWGEWIIETGGLDESRWLADGDGITPLEQYAICGRHKNLIQINTITGNLEFDPARITNTKSSFCKELKYSYPSGSNRIIPLATTGE